MYLLRCWLFLFAVLILCTTAFAQQDVNFHLNGTFLASKNVIKVKRDFNDPYLWALTSNHEVYRINSLTKEVKDFTAQFVPYASQPFIDIAGRSPDTVFVATQSQLVEYKMGSMKTIGQADGLTGNVNAIGFDYHDANGGFDDDGTFYSTELIVSTSNGIFRYLVSNEKFRAHTVSANLKLFEASYRNQMIVTLQARQGYDDLMDHYPAVELEPTTTAEGYLWMGGSTYGNTLRSSFYTSGTIYGGYNFVYSANLFWATEKGLFQCNWDYSYYSNQPHNHYLDGVQINKITSIYGLLNINNSTSTTYTHENLLVGSNQGLYFSNSRYLTEGLPDYTFYHYDELGNKTINDINVNATNKPEPYGIITEPVCENGIWIAASDGLYLLKPDYSAYVDRTNFRSIQFDNQADTISQLQICANSTAKAIVQSNGLGYNIQWYKDGKELPNESNDSLTIKEAGEYYIALYDACSGIHFKSNHLKVSVIDAPVFSFNYPDQLYYCNASSATLKTDNNAAYHYRWYTNGILNGDTTSSINITQSGKYKVEVAACLGSWTTSKEVQVNFINIPVPVISADKPAYCIGDQATLSVNFTNDGTYTINWFQDGNLLSDDRNKTSIITNQAGNYSVSISSNLSSCNQLSAAYPVSFAAPPTVSIQQVVNTTLCDGQNVTLKASYSGGDIKWSTGETASEIQVNQSGTYSATVTTAAGCTTAQSFNLNLFPNPVLALADASLCEYINETITLTAPSGFSKYEWNGQNGGNIFKVSKLGTVSLTVTDRNGCTASQTINVSGHCSDIHLPNTITPNGDGINDTWAILGLEGDASATVKIYNRLGTLIYQSQGYSTPWDGTYRGQKLPTGVYYYIINAHQGKQVLSGSITILY